MMSDEQFAALMERLEDIRADILEARRNLDKVSLRGSDLVVAINRSQKRRGKPDVA